MKESQKPLYYKMIYSTLLPCYAGDPRLTENKIIQTRLYYQTMHILMHSTVLSHYLNSYVKTKLPTCDYTEVQYVYGPNRLCSHWCSGIHYTWTRMAGQECWSLSLHCLHDLHWHHSPPRKLMW